MTSADLVSVVVPSYNAARTLDETLLSVRGQTHTSLEIIVVDDGSTDATAAIAQQHAAADPRIRVIRQPNGGVAAARNTGWQAANADFVALIDSDDLWAHNKIELQLQALAAAGPKAGFVYCFFTHIDANGMAGKSSYPTPCSGDVLDQILAHNFVGNGSSMLVRREVLLDCGGFDNSLREAGAQGCDDYLFCCRAAENFHYAVVPEILVGYRAMPGSVSSSLARMLRSWMLVSDQMLARHPAKREIILLGLRNYVRWLLGGVVYHFQVRHFIRIMGLLLRYHPRIAGHIAAVYLPATAIHMARGVKHRLARKLRGKVITPPTPVHFQIGQLPTLHQTD